MLRLFKYLKRYGGALALIMVFLALQAMCELALPSYTADIVDVGIQQGGIASPVPQRIRDERLEALSRWMTAAEYREQVLPAYTLTEGVYTYHGKPTDEKALAPLFLRAWMADTALNGTSAAGFSLQALAPDLSDAQSLAALLAQMDEAPREAVIQKTDAVLATLPESLLTQAAVASVAAEYQALGESVQMSYILISGLKMLGVALATALLAVLIGFVGSRLAAALGRDLRSRVFGRVAAFSQQEMDSFSTASLMTRTTNDIQQIQGMVVMLCRTVFFAPIIGIGGILKVLNTNTSMSWVIALAISLLFLLLLFLFTTTMPRFKIQQVLVDKLNLVTREILTGLPVIRAFSTQGREEERFDSASAALMKTQLFVNRMMSGMMPAMMLIMNGVTILIMWTGSQGIAQGTMQVGDMMAFIQYTMQIIMAFLMIAIVSVMLPRAAVSLKRIDEVLETQPAIQSPDQPIPFDAAEKGQVRFDHVSFRYPGSEENVLTDLCFTARPGETTAILGGTGAGKSTLVNLIPRFYDVTQGSITVDGADVRQADLNELRQRIGFVPQKGMLFSGTIASNIRYGAPELDNAGVAWAAGIAQAKDFIEEKPLGYEESVAQGGTNVSGGQKQRLSIARAVAKKPEIYIFDDSFSALDFKTDLALRTALSRQTQGSTVIIVAQRISTVLTAQQIIVLDEGRIVGKGTHQELMRTCEVYQQIASSQLSKEELQNAE